jgi:hypothetical protein
MDEELVSAQFIMMKVGALAWADLGKPKEDMKQMDSYAITSIMTQIRGWEKGGAPVSVRGYGMQRVYRRR